MASAWQKTSEIKPSTTSSTTGGIISDHSSHISVTQQGLSGGSSAAVLGDSSTTSSLKLHREHPRSTTPALGKPSLKRSQTHEQKCQADFHLSHLAACAAGEAATAPHFRSGSGAPSVPMDTHTEEEGRFEAASVTSSAAQSAESVLRSVIVQLGELLAAIKEVDDDASEASESCDGSDSDPDVAPSDEDK